MTLLIVNVCAFANRTANLPQHVGAMSWHQAKFHYFHACFGFTGIKKLSFSMFPTQPRCPDFWIIPISCMEPRNLPEDTHVIFQPTLVHWNMCLYFKFELCTQRWHVPSQNHEPSWEKLRFARSLYQNLFLFGQFFYHGMVLPWHDTMPSFMILKPSFSMFSTEPRCPDVWILFSFFAWDLLPPSIYIGPNVFFKTTFDYWQD